MTKRLRILKCATSLLMVSLTLFILIDFFILPCVAKISMYFEQRTVLLQRIEELTARFIEYQKSVNELLRERKSIISFPATIEQAKDYINSDYQIIRDIMSKHDCRLMEGLGISEKIDEENLLIYQKAILLEGAWNNCLAGLYHAAGSVNGPIDEITIQYLQDDKINIKVTIMQFAPNEGTAG